MAQFKESRELIEGVGELSKVVIEALMDGFQTSDVMTLVAAASGNPKIKAAINGVSKVKDEFKNMDAEKSIAAIKELTPPTADAVGDIITALTDKAK